MFNIGSASKTNNGDDYAYDVDIFKSYDFGDYLDIFGADFWDNGTIFLQKLSRVAFAKLPIIDSDLINKIDRELPKTGQKDNLLRFLIKNVDKKLVGSAFRL